MTRARSISLASGVFTAGVLVFLLFALGGFTSPLPSTWEMKYTNLKDDLRALAVNPLDPQILYVGTDQAVLGSTDGGQTWNQLYSFRDDKIDISDVLSDEAIQVLTDIGADAAQASAPAGQAEESAPKEAERAPRGRESAPSGTGGSGTSSTAELAGQVETALQKMTETQDALAQAEDAYMEWTPDELTISEVDGIPEDDSGFVEQPMYDELANWLSERSLSVPDNGAERKDTLVDYLKTHEAEGETLSKAVDSAKSQYTNAEGEYNNLKAQLEQAEAAQGQAEDQEEMAATEEFQSEEAGASAPEPGAQSTPAIEGGYLTGVTDLAVNPANPDHVFATTFDGVYRSPDGGQTWESIYTGANPRQGCSLCITIDPSNPDIILLGTLVGVGISKDGGVSWTRALGSLSNDVVTAVAVHPFDSSVILAGTQGDGIFKSTDGGDSWEKVFNNPSSGAQNIGAVAFAPANPNIVYAGTQNGIYVS
ncbi:MAG TPA: hypothetical protein PK636_05330, partial [bacterium]|nr:hypothetical protein [bacterium]